MRYFEVRYLVYYQFTAVHAGGTATPYCATGAAATLPPAHASLFAGGLDQHATVVVCADVGALRALERYEARVHGSRNNMLIK